MWSKSWRVIRVLPVIGVFIVLASAGEVLRRKGYALGLLALVLDILPVICIIKACIEVFTGDLIPDRSESDPAREVETTA
jgi:uncharacterized membrane protein YoaK (UPF0700 family)